ncbi:MAG TPA: DNA-processing protein DprA [bacterium]|nr:DNA-processing protein DprA [bacterium]
MMDRKTAWIILNMANGIGPASIRKMLELCKTPQQILDTEPSVFEKLIPAAAIEQLKKWQQLPWEQEIEKAKAAGITVISIDESQYPENLKQIPDPPPVLYVKGKIPQECIFIAIVGTRNPSFYGSTMAEKFASALASYGICIVSGMARGIDSIAHKAALKMKTPTVAVLGSGLANIYPPENEKLAEQISQNGAVISEFPLDTSPEKFNFPRRNRIISGLSKAVIVIEAGLRSGALITAHLAADQNRDVFVLPSDANRITGRGNNQLIKEGACLVESPEEILQQMNLQVRDEIQNSDSSVEHAELSEKEKLVYNVLRRKNLRFEQIQMQVNSPVAEIMQILTNLEIKGFIKSGPGLTYSDNRTVDIKKNEEKI